MKRKILSLILAFSILLVSCTSENTTSSDTTSMDTSHISQEAREKHSTVIFDVFDTIISVVTYQDADDFEKMKQTIEDEYIKYHQLYDVYNNYEDINNIKTINDNAGVAPVVVDEEIINLLEFSKEWYYKTDGKFDISMGNLLSVWSDVRSDATNGIEYTLPNYDDLKLIADTANIEAIEIDRENSTVYINDANVQIDVGAVAKGYATEQIALLLEENYDNFAISAGGNVRIHGQPFDGERSRWAIGIDNPNVDENYFPKGGTVDTAFINGNMSVVCSGGYQRYFVHEGERYHHLIDLQTLYPANIYNGVAIIYPDSGVADVLSTAVFFMPPEEALEFISSIDGAAAQLITTNETVYASENINLYLQSAGITNTTP